jgi:hypothetical protein
MVADQQRVKVMRLERIGYETRRTAIDFRDRHFQETILERAHVDGISNHTITELRHRPEPKQVHVQFGCAVNPNRIGDSDLPNMKTGAAMLLGGIPRV